MTETSSSHPGTVSNILWHFTGGPTWNDKEKRQNVKPKNAKDAYSNLIKILTSRTLKLGSYSERLEIAIPAYVVNKSLINEPPAGTRTEIIESSPVCCLADVPIMHLEYIARRYGKFAIGFRRDSVVNSNFNPVLYTLKDKLIIKKVFKSIGSLEAIDDRVFDQSMNDLMELSNMSSKTIFVDKYNNIYKNINRLRNRFREARDGIAHLLAFVKTFDNKQWHTVYCEREWRSTEEYQFKFNDVALIVIPRMVNKVQYYEEFCSKLIGSINIPMTIPVVPWEDIIEY